MITGSAKHIGDIRKGENMATVAKEGIYYVLDTEVENISESWIVKGLNGTQGDSLRKVNLAIKEGTMVLNGKTRPKPKNLAGLAVRFRGKDSDGKRKYVESTYEIINESAGLVSITLPAEVFAAHGDYQSAFIQIYDPNGIKNESTFKVALTVIENDVMFTTNPSNDYIDQVEKLIEECSERFDVASKELNKRVEAFSDTLALQEKRAGSIEELLNNLIKLVEQKGVPTFGGDNVYTGITQFTQFIQGHITGTVIKRFTSEDAPQDMNNVDVLREMKVGTSEASYYSDNQLSNNPMSNSWVFVTRHKISAATVYETAMTFDGKGYGVLKARTVGGLDAVPALTEWGIFGEWGQKWKSLVPYLSDEFIAHSTAPEYRIVGSKVEFRGAVTAKKTIANTKNVSVKLTKELPFNFIGGQEVIKVSGGPAIYALFAYGNQLEMQKHQIGGVWADIGAGNYIGISSTFDMQ